MGITEKEDRTIPYNVVYTELKGRVLLIMDNNYKIKEVNKNRK